MEKRTNQINEDNILESLKKKEDEFEKELTVARGDAGTCIRNAKEKTRLLETGLEDELKALKEKLVKEEKIKHKKIIKSINKKNTVTINTIKKQFLHNKEAAIECVVEAVIPKTTGTRSKANDKKNE